MEDDEFDDIDAPEEGEARVEIAREKPKLPKVITYLAWGIGASVAGCVGMAGYELPQALEVRDIKDDIVALKGGIENDVVPAAKNAKTNPQALTEILKKKEAEFVVIIEKLEKLQKKGFHLRPDIIDEVMKYILEARGHTYIKPLEDCRDSFFCSMFVDTSQYEPLRIMLQKINKDLNKIRMILLRMEDIDQPSLTNNSDVNFYVALGGGSESFFKKRDENAVVQGILKQTALRKEKRTETVKVLEGQEFVEKGKSFKFDWSSLQGEYKIREVQQLLFNIGLLASEKQITGKKDKATEQTLEWLFTAWNYGYEMLDGKYDPDEAVKENEKARTLQKFMKYLGYLEKDDVDGKYHEKTHCRFKKLIDDIKNDEEKE